jgi:hypothetical protein
VLFRSTVGIRHEAEFLNAIAGVVGEENLEDARKFLAEAAERTEAAVASFSYIAVHSSCAPKSGRDAMMAAVPRPYETARAQVTALLRKRFPTKKHSWIDGLATAECKVKTKAGVSAVTVSLRGVMLFEALVAKERQGIGDIVSLSRLPQEQAEPLLRTFMTGGLVVAAGGGGQLQGALIGINQKFHTKKIVLADNWESRAAKVKNMSQARVVAAHACIIKIMKGAREMSKQQLVERVLRETSRLFQLSMEDLRRCVQLAIAERFIEEVDGVYLRYIE